MIPKMNYRFSDEIMRKRHQEAAGFARRLFLAARLFPSLARLDSMGLLC
jgi:hypothetical protein